jgi:hypothetical protein
MKNLLLLLALVVIQHTAIAQPKKAAPKAPATKAAANSDSLDLKIKELYQAGEYAQVIEVINTKLKLQPKDTAKVIVKAMCQAMLRQKEACVATIKTFFVSPDTSANILASLPTYLSKDIARGDGLWYCWQMKRTMPKLSP